MQRCTVCGAADANLTLLLLESLDDRKRQTGPMINIAPQPSTQQLVPTENVQRQIAVMVVVTMEEARFLLAMQWRVRGIQVQNNGARCFVLGLQEERDQQFINGFWRIGDLVVALGGRRTSRRQFQPVQRAFAC